MVRTIGKANVVKTKTMYVCNNCGEESLTWQGRCPVCGEWNTFQEFKAPPASYQRGGGTAAPAAVMTRLGDSENSTPAQRLASTFREFDRVLGGGMVPGSVILLGGDPGIGKSTLLLQVAESLGKQHKVLYFSGEESQQQVADRARRLGIGDHFFFANETRLDVIRSLIDQEQPQVVVVDSIQTLYDDSFPSTPGSLVQVRECSLQLQSLAKRTGTSIILVGHITKEGTVAGPKTLEHMVDVVLYLEGDPRSEMRLLRSMKNRFGATYEVGIFELAEQGLRDVTDPSALFIEHHTGDIAGTALSAVLEGARPILVEVQALVTLTSFGYPKRTSSGLDLQRLQILLAILESHTPCSFANADVFINVVGGYRIQDRSADLALCMALLSAASKKPLPAKQVFYGEVGLTGEIRPVPQLRRRHEEVERLGYTAPPAIKTIRSMGETFQVFSDRPITRRRS